MDYIPNPNAYYSGTVVKIFHNGSNGFIQIYGGPMVYFNRTSCAPNEKYFAEGEAVACKLQQVEDSKDASAAYVAVDLIREWEL